MTHLLCFVLRMHSFHDVDGVRPFIIKKITTIKGFFCASIMSNLLNLRTEELRKIDKLRNVDVYENISREQLQNIFTTPPASIPTPTPITSPIPRPIIRTLPDNNTPIDYK